MSRWQGLTGLEQQRVLRVLSVQASHYLRATFHRRLPLTPASQQEIPDLVNRALEQMVQKLPQFDPSRGNFTTWLYHCCVRPVLREHLRQLNYRLVSLEQYLLLLEARTSQSALPRGTRLAEYVAALSPVQAKTELQRVTTHRAQGQRFLSIRYPETLPMPQPTVPETDSFCQARLQTQLAQLPTNERVVVVGIFFWGHSQRQIAQQLKISPVRVHQLKTQALRRLRRRLGEDFWSS
ncbi:sigma-70 family RNA polymerase sigma factor [Candidatus Cyanaurora vandensis]|uniref:sigma-70 family RNA polymerase sigma factor n=1 Tax=Candidatus Cyanaurora vandensis TaxID=2714958 RepID=UPI0025808054|nr:sigma-70 family RNA polymerase sigma factor [Candidatus Cyanaurora vandensis]